MSPRTCLIASKAGGGSLLRHKFESVHEIVLRKAAYSMETSEMCIYVCSSRHLPYCHIVVTTVTTSSQKRLNSLGCLLVLAEGVGELFHN